MHCCIYNPDLPLLQVRLPEVLGNVHGDVEEGQISDGNALTLEADKGKKDEAVWERRRRRRGMTATNKITVPTNKPIRNQQDQTTRVIFNNKTRRVS